MNELSKTVMLKLKRLRKEQKVSVEAVRQYLQRHGIEAAQKTIYGWEEGRTSSSVAEFLLLAKLYGIEDINYFFQEDAQEDVHPLSSREKQMIANYRSCGEIRAAVDKLLNME